MTSFPSERARLTPARHAALIARSRILARIRHFFAARDFVEIESPILVPCPGLELHLDAFAVESAGYLATSPEYQMKRLLAGGMDKIYSLGRVFRRGERGLHHNPEFTMLEWYRANVAWQTVAADVEALVGELTRAETGGTILHGVDVGQPWEHLAVRDAMKKFANVTIDGNEPVEELRATLAAAGHRLPAHGDWSDLFFTVFLDANVERQIGQLRPTLLYDWPRPLAALAQARPDDPRVVERFEVFIGGMELCNAFGELIDPVEQRARSVAEQAERARRGLPVYPLDEKFLAAVGQLPPSAGIALGVDRLVMLLTGAADIKDVLAFAAEEL